MASEYTPNYNLDKYVGTDKPNLRDQYNSAMDKIDAQFVVIENGHTETNNQISAINTNMTQLGVRVTAAEGKVTAVEGQISQTNNEISQTNNEISQTNTKLAAVKQTAENANSQANTNATAIEGINTQLGTVQQGVSDLQGKTRSLVLFEASDTSKGIILYGGANFWGVDRGTLNAEIPDWANWIDFYFMSMDATYWKQGAAAYADTVAFASPAICQTFPAKRLAKSASSTAIVSQPITNFAIVLPPLMGVHMDGSAGRQAITFGNVPFKINGKVVTQNMGLDTTGGSGGSFKNAYGGAAMVFKTATPEYSNSQGSVNLLKVVARA